MNRRQHHHLLLRALVERALRGAEALPPLERADLHEAAGLALRRADPQAADIAFHLAGLLRQAENSQLQFAALLQNPLEGHASSCP